jgi:hypothetical protein
MMSGFTIRAADPLPGFHASLSLGFELCGLDTGLYGGTPAAGEVALFLERPLR